MLKLGFFNLSSTNTRFLFNHLGSILGLTLTVISQQFIIFLIQVHNTNKICFFTYINISRENQHSILFETTYIFHWNIDIIFLQSKSLKEATYLYFYYKDLEFSKWNHHSHLFALLVFCCHDFINFFYVIILFINFMLYCVGFKSLSHFCFSEKFFEKYSWNM